VIDRGLAGDIPDTPKPGDTSLKRAQAMVIGSRMDAMEGARVAAIERGYQAIVMPGPVTGEAREAAPEWLERARNLIGATPRKVCVISSGETTVRVTGKGAGGRNLEFALAIAEAIAALPRSAMASIGTDGIDGPTDAAGAIVDSSTLQRAQAAGLDPREFLNDNNTYVFFERLGDLIKTGPTATNVGDLQVILAD
jgi:hydroxypyruvate reductase